MADSTITPKPYRLGPPILTVDKVNKHYGPKVILRDVNFQVSEITRPEIAAQGDVVSILGRSGMGKTTLAQIIAGLQKPTSGNVLVNNENRELQKGEVGFVFQDYLAFDHLTVEGNLLLAASQGIFRQHAHQPTSKNFGARFYTRFFDKKILQDKVDATLDLFRDKDDDKNKNLFGIRDNFDQYPCQLSGGQRQRLAILMQVLCSSRYIVFDEPYSGQDPVMKQKACEMIIKVSQMGGFSTLFVITHDIPCAIWASDTLLFMGKERDPETNQFKPGATVFKPFSLAEHNLAWQDAEICRTREFNDLAQTIQYEWFKE